MPPKKTPKVAQTKRRVNRRSSLLARADPPAILPEPFNALVVELNWTGATSSNYVVTLSTLASLILQQLGLTLTSGTNLAFRLLEVGIWELTGKGITVAFHDLDDKVSVDADFAPIVTKLDTPGRNKWAHVHYRWPRDNRNNTLRAVGEPANFEVLSLKPGVETAGDARIKSYIRVSWRTSATESPGRREQPTGAFRHAIALRAPFQNPLYDQDLESDLDDNILNHSDLDHDE